MDSGRSTRALPRVGFPIRRSRDQRLVSTSPGLIAAAHVLLRLLAPRHPPCALSLLTRKEHVSLPLWSFQGARGSASTRRHARSDGLSKLNSVTRSRSPAREPVESRSVEVDVVPGEPEASDGSCMRLLGNANKLCWAMPTKQSHRTSSDACRSKSSGIPRKEVIQPQLPLRLPCYDFTPIIDPTFDGCLLRRG